jgi:hypothetical protein
MIQMYTYLDVADNTGVACGRRCGERAQRQLQIEIRRGLVAEDGRKPRLHVTWPRRLGKNLQRWRTARRVGWITLSQYGRIDAAPIVEAKPRHRSDRARRSTRVQAASRGDHALVQARRTPGGALQHLGQRNVLH